MYNAGKIIAGLIVFLLIVTYPFINRVVTKPVVDVQKVERLKIKKPKEFTIAEHMTILDEWRDSAVRDGKRIYIGSDEKKYPISLQRNCLPCHSKEKLCDRCHNYVGVKPYCWNCHIEAKE